MRFKIDENLPLEVADDLRAAGHDAHTVADEGMAGATDAATMAHVKVEGRVLLTMDKGIGRGCCKTPNWSRFQVLQTAKMALCNSL